VPKMSTLHHETIMEQIYEEVQEDHPELDQDAWEAIAKIRFEARCL